MKVLKYIFVILLLIVLILGALSFVLPTDMKVEESISIDASKSVVKDQIVYFENSQKWSPWSEIDPDMESWIEGEDGKVGAKYFWSGNDDAGEGSQEITSITEDQMDMKIKFKKPFESEADTNFKYKEKSEGVEVTWGFSSEMKRPFNLMNFFFNMEESIAKEYRKGLSSLKETAEALDKNQASDFAIEKVNFEIQNYLIKRETVSFDEMQSFYERNLQEIYSYINTTENLKINGNSSGIYFSWNEEEMNTDMAVAVPFSLVDESKRTETLDFEVKELSGEAYKLAFYGDYEKLASAHEAIHEYLEKNNIEMYEVALEEYVTGPAEDSNPEKWLTNIYYFKK